MKQAIILVDHGSRLGEANEVLREMALVVNRMLPEAIVRFAHMELAPPTLAEAFDECVADGAEEVIVHPYFLGPGNHSTLDIPRLVAEASSRHPEVRTRIAEPLGVHEKIGEVILDRIRTAREPEG